MTTGNARTKGEQGSPGGINPSEAAVPHPDHRKDQLSLHSSASGLGASNKSFLEISRVQSDGPPGTLVRGNSGM